MFKFVLHYEGDEDMTTRRVFGTSTRVTRVAVTDMRIIWTLVPQPERQVSLSDIDNMEDKKLIFAVVSYVLEESPPLDADVEDDDDAVALLVAAGLVKRESVPRILGFAEETVEKFSEWDFKNHFRLCRATFELILERIGPQLQPVFEFHGMCITPRKQLLIFLWFISNGDSFRAVCNLFGISQSSAHSVVRRVSSKLVENRRLVIAWGDAHNRGDISNTISRRFNLHECVGFIDGTHIRLSCALNGDNDYYNRKDIHPSSFSLL